MLGQICETNIYAYLLTIMIIVDFTTAMNNRSSNGLAHSTSNCSVLGDYAVKIFSFFGNTYLRVTRFIAVVHFRPQQNIIIYLFP